MELNVITEEKGKLISSINHEIMILEAQIKSDLYRVQESEKRLIEKREILSILLPVGN